MNIEFSDTAKEDFEGFERQLQLFFKSHLEKLSEMPPRRHLKHGVPHHVENVTKQARMVYNIESDTLYIIRCFATHKEYEKWYRSYQQ
ncbi:hypothetical protein HYV43_04835 [Candidatus Micrarchaeota archaeon]|nr:hypothetical protein [Candidatus Micrarchaeota archaeon]